MSPDPDCWGHWWGRKQFSLQVVQHPLRARMCGFGDKDRRPLAPAAVAKMVVRREDDSIVDVDELDSSFFLVTVDLWSADGKREMNLVLHPTSSNDRHPSTSTVPAKPKKPRSSIASVASPRSDHASPPSSHSTPSSAPDPRRPSIDSQPVISTVMSTESGFVSPAYPYTAPEHSVSDAIAYSNSVAYNATPNSSDPWAYTHTGAQGSHTLQNHPLRNAPRCHVPPPTPADTWNSPATYRSDDDPSSFRTWPGAESSYQTPIHPQHTVYNNHDIDSSNRHYHPAAQPDGREYHQWNHSQQDSYPQSFDLYDAPSYPQQSPQTPHFQGNHTQNNASSSSSPHLSSHLPARHIYTRTLVGPLSSNACRLLDEHQTPGIFFLFQDLSIRTEGTFRLRLRLMNVGDSPTPEAGAQRVHTNISPVLAQTFTDPFVVFSAKRFPGVPETTALSIAFGNQGQKLPLRNRHGTGKLGRKPHREGDSDGSESSGDT